MSDEKNVSLNFLEEIIENDLKVGTHNGRVLTRFPPEPNMPNLFASTLGWLINMVEKQTLDLMIPIRLPRKLNMWILLRQTLNGWGLNGIMSSLPVITLINYSNMLFN